MCVDLWCPADTIYIKSSHEVLNLDRRGWAQAPTLRSDFLRLYAEMYNGETAPHAPVRSPGTPNSTCQPSLFSPLGTPHQHTSLVFSVRAV